MLPLEIWLIVATIAGPILAVQTQKWIERATEKRRARIQIFHALMANRATRLNDDFVRALNQIDLEFSRRRFGGTKDRAVINAWRALFGEYQQGSIDFPNDAATQAWAQRVDDRLVVLLSAMANSLGYDFSEEELRRGIYYPRGRREIEDNQLAVLQGVKNLLEGRNTIGMRVVEFPASPDLITAQLEMAQRSSRAYAEDGALRVKMENRE